MKLYETETWSCWSGDRSEWYRVEKINNVRKKVSILAASTGQLLSYSSFFGGAGRASKPSTTLELSRSSNTLLCCTVPMIKQSDLAKNFYWCCATAITRHPAVPLIRLRKSVVLWLMEVWARRRSFPDVNPPFATRIERDRLRPPGTDNCRRWEK